MNRMMVIAVLICTYTYQVYAAVPETVVIRARKGNVTFTHKKHDERGMLIDCKECHSSETGGRIGKLGIGLGHSMCRQCHTINSSGPRECDDCHK